MKTKKLLIGLLAGALLFNSSNIRAFAAETPETETIVASTSSDTTGTETTLKATDTETTKTSTDVTQTVQEEATLTEEEKIAAEKEAQAKAEAEKKAEEAKAEEAKAEKAAKAQAAKEAALKKKQTAEYKKQVKYLTALIYTEAGNQSYKGKVAVANVVLNRVDSKKITAEKIRNVIYAPNQFSVVRNGSFKRAMDNYNDFDSANEKECIKAAKAALDGKNYVGNRRYFTRYSRSLANSHPSGTKIGDHYFW